MAKIKIEIDLGNVAFEDSPMLEVSRILAQLGDRLVDCGTPPRPIALYDINGNRVGEAKITGKR